MPSVMYPGSVAVDILNYACLPERHAVIEIGSGRGHATELFLQDVSRITCLEPDIRSAVALSGRFPGRVQIERRTFEDYVDASPDPRFDLAFAAQSWHLLDPRRRLPLAGEVLRSGGVLACFWNRAGETDQRLRDLIVNAHEEHGVVHLARLTLDDPAAPSPSAALADELRSDALFRAFTQRAHPVDYELSKDAYLRILASLVPYRRLPCERLAGLLGAVSAAFDRMGRSLHIQIVTDLILCRRR